MKDLSIDVSVVVCAYNEERRLDECLESLVAQDYDPSRFEIIVVDNESTDATGEIAKRWVKQTVDSKPRLSYLRISHCGLSVGRNTGIRHAQGNVIAFIDGDAIASPSWVSEISKWFAANEGMRIAGGEVCLLNPDSWTARALYDSVVSYATEHANRAIGTNMAFSEELLRGEAPFHPSMSRRGDDAYVFRKLRDLAVPERIRGARVFHEAPETVRGWLKSRFDNGFFSAQIDLVEGEHARMRRLAAYRMCFFALPAATVASFVSGHAPLGVATSAVFTAMCVRRYLFSGMLSEIIRHFWHQREGRAVGKVALVPGVICLVGVGVAYCDFGYIVRFARSFKSDEVEESSSSCPECVKEMVTNFPAGPLKPRHA